MYFLDNHFSLGQSDVFFLMLLVLFGVLNQCSFIVTLLYNGKNKLLKKITRLEYRFGCHLLLFNKGATKSTFFQLYLKPVYSKNSSCLFAQLLHSNEKITDVYNI